MDKLAAMRAFVTIVEHGSLSAAGAALDRSLPAMVRTLAALEASLGVVLLRRTTRRMSLTGEGRTYLDHCRRILEEVDAVEASLADADVEPRGPLRITAPVLFGRRHVAPVAIDFARRHPKVELELLLLDRVVDMVEEGVDAGVRIAHLADSSTVVTSVGTMRAVVCASPALLRDHGTPRHPEDLEARPCVTVRALAAAGGWRFRREGRDVLVEPHAAFATNDVAAAVDACAAGLGFGRFLAYQVADHLARRRLRVVLADVEPPPLPVSLVRPQARLVAPRLRRFLDHLGAALRKSLGGRA